jgi:hypothetical protein
VRILIKRRTGGGVAKSKSLRDEKGNIGVSGFFTYFEDPHLEDQTKHSRGLPIEGAHKRQRSKILELVCPKLAQRNLLPKDPKKWIPKGPKELVSKDPKEAKLEGALKKQRSEILEVVCPALAKRNLIPKDPKESISKDPKEAKLEEALKRSRSKPSTDRRDTDDDSRTPEGILIPKELIIEGDTDPKEAESAQRSLIPKDPKKLTPKDSRELIPKDLKELIPKDPKELTPKDPKELIPKDPKELIPKYRKEATLEGALKRSRSEPLTGRRDTDDAGRTLKGHLIPKELTIEGGTDSKEATLEGVFKRSRSKPLKSMCPRSEQRDTVDVGSTPDLKRTEEELDEASRRAREKKAVKSDDAGVPEYLWLEHLVDDGPAPWPAKAVAGLPRAAILMRRVMLRWSKRKLCARLWNGVQLGQRKNGLRPRMGTSLVLNKDVTSRLSRGRLATLRNGSLGDKRPV